MRCHAAAVRAATHPGSPWSRWGVRLLSRLVQSPPTPSCRHTGCAAGTPQHGNKKQKENLGVWFSGSKCCLGFSCRGRQACLQFFAQNLSGEDHAAHPGATLALLSSSCQPAISTTALPPGSCLLPDTARIYKIDWQKSKFSGRSSCHSSPQAQSAHTGVPVPVPASLPQQQPPLCPWPATPPVAHNANKQQLHNRYILVTGQTPAYSTPCTRHDLNGG